MLSLIALTFLAPTEIDFSCPPERLQTLLPALGRITGQKLQSDPVLSQEVMILHVEDVKPYVLLEQIAKVAGAEWRSESDGTLVLSRPPKLQSALTAKSTTERATNIRTSLLRNASSGFLTTREIEAGIRRVQLHNANVGMLSEKEAGSSLKSLLNLPERLLRLPLLAASLPWESLATGRTVFSDRPNGMQKPFPEEAQERLQAMYQAQRLLVEAGSKYPSTSSPPGYQIDFGEVFGTQKDVPAEIVLATTVMPNYVLLSLSMLNDKGGIVRYGTLRADPSPEFPQALTKLEALDRSFRLEGIAGRMVKAYSQPARTLEPDLRERVLDPDTYEPLGDSMLQGFQTLGRDAKLNVVALLPDFPTPQASTVNDNLPQSYRDFIVRLNAVSPMRHELKDGWYHAFPQDREQVRRERLDRPTLKRYLQRIARAGTLPFDELAEYAYRFPTTNDNAGPVLASRLQALLPLGRRNEVLDWQTLRLWGSLSKDHRLRFLRGEQVPLLSLPSSTRDLLNNLVFFSEWGTLNARMGAEMVEPTEKLPEGLPADTTLMASIERFPRLWSWDRIDGSTVGEQHPIQALQKDSSTKPEARHRYLPAYNSNLEFLVRINPLQWFVGTVQNHLWIDRSLTPAPLLNLPKPFLSTVVASIDEEQWTKIPEGYAAKLRKSSRIH